VVVRYAEARQIGDGLVADAVHELAATVDAPAGATLVVNPTARARTGLVDVRIPGSGPCHLVAPDGTPRPTQLVADARAEGFQTMVADQKVRWVLDVMRGTEFAGRQITRYEVNHDGTLYEVVLHEARGGEEHVDLTELKAEMLALGEAGNTIRVFLSGAPVRHVVFDPGPVDGFGWACFTAAEGPTPPTAVRADGVVLANEHLTVTVDDTDGTYTIETADGIAISGLGRLVDGGDGGDTYNYSPPDDDIVIDRPVAVRVQAVEPGPVRAKLRIDAEYMWPRAAEGDERACTRRTEETVQCTVATTLELRTGEPFLRVRHDIDNQARDHRLRAEFPLPAAVAGSDAECAFTVVHRGLTAEGGLHEYPLPTFPSRRFVDASDGNAGLALVHDGLLEYEVVDNGRRLALTLLRSVGYLSRTEPQLRPNPAGPQLALDKTQLLGRQRAEYAVVVHAGDWRAADCYGLADAVLVPFERTRVSGRSTRMRPAHGAALHVHGAEVSAVTRVPGGLVVRVFRTAAEDGPVTVEHEGVPARGFVVDLQGAPLRAFEGEITMRPWEIATLQLA
jgi:hypothetical protein